MHAESEADNTEQTRSNTPDHVSDQRHAATEAALGMVGTAQREVGSLEAQAASITWWDADADAYHGEHGEFLGTADFVWCPEALREQDARLLGEVRGRDVLEVGCGSAPCSRWLAGQGARPVAFDLSAGMLRYARAGNASSGIEVPLVRANAERIPFADASFDLACSAFGAVPFVSDLHRLHREVARVLRPGGTWTFAVNHPMRWIFPDVPGPVGMTVTSSYFDRTPYLEVDADGRATYVEYHRTMGDHVEAITSAGLALERLIEPEWPDGLTREWGQWTPERGAMFPGTVIFLCRKGRT